MLKIGKSDRNYYFYLYDDSEHYPYCNSDEAITHGLNMEIFDYRNILIKNRAIIDVLRDYSNSGDFKLRYFFERNEDAQKALEELEAYAVMAKLTSEN